MTKISFIISLILSFVFLLAAPSVFALEVPQFPSCVAPQGTLKVSYEAGIHGIPGSEASYSGQDSVYLLGAGNALQCFCPPSGNGIQTNWLKLSEVSVEEVESYKKQGWVYVPDGSAWGLDAAPYLAQNVSYSCLSGGNGGNGGNGGTSPASAPVCPDSKPSTPTLTSVNRNGSQAVLTWTAASPVTHYTISYGTSPDNYQYGVPNTGNVTTYTVGSLDVNKNYYFSVRAVNGCMPGDASNRPTGGQVLGASTSKGGVLGLANTGNTSTLALLLVAGSLLLSASYAAYRKDRV